MPSINDLPPPIRQRAPSGGIDDLPPPGGEPGLLQSAIRAYDSYASAPIRKGIGALQDGKGLGAAVGEAWDQAGEDPSLAPSGEQIARREGFNDQRKTLRTAEEQRRFDELNNPGLAASHRRMGHVGKDVESFSPAEVAGFGIETAADVTNLIPAAGMAKRAVKAGVGVTDVALRAGGKVIAKGGALAEKGGMKALSGAFGVDEAQARRYLQNHERLKDVVDTRSAISTIKDDMDSTLQPLRERVGSAKGRVGAAKERRAEELARLRDAQGEGKESLRLAQEQRLGETAARVSGDVQRLNKDVSAGSEKAFQILDDEGVRVPVSPIKGDLTKGIKALEASAVTDEQVAVVELLKRYRERLDKFGKDVSGGEAKRLIQSLDREMNHLAPGSVGRLSKDDQVLGVLRRRFDAPLKASPEYAQQMAGVSADTRLLKGAEGMATEGGAARALQAAGKPSGADRAEILRLLGEKNGQNYLAAVDRSTLPEYQKLKGLLQRYRAARKGGELKAAQSELDAAIGELAPFRNVAPNEFGQSGAEALIRNQLRPKTAGLDQGELVRSMDQKFGKNYSGQIEDAKTIAAFDKEFTRGSANTNFWAAVTGSIGFLAGGGAAGGVLGGGAGALFGRLVVDKFGPQSARAILDQVAKLKTMAPKDWVARLQVPEHVKKQLLAELPFDRMANTARAGVAAAKPFRGGELRQVAEAESDRKPAGKGPDAWAAKGAAMLGLSDVSNDPAVRRLLIEASDLSPGSPRLQRIKEQIQKGVRK